MAAKAYERDGGLSRHRHRPCRSRPHDGRPAGLRSRHRRRTPRHGQDRARHQYRLQHRQGLSTRNSRAGRHARNVNGGIVGFFSLEMSSEQLATRIIAEQSQVPSYKIRRGDITEQDFHRIAEAAREMQTHSLLYRPDRRHFHRPADRPRPPPQAPARPRPAGGRLSSTPVRHRNPRATTGCRSLPKSPPA